MEKQLNRNIWMLYIFSFFWLSMVIISVIVPFLQSRGLSLAQVFYLQAMFATFMVMFEVPSGYVADILGRKNALVAGALFHGIGSTWLCFAHGFAQLALVEFALGLGASLVSGTDLSLLYDTQEALAHSIQQRTRGIANMRFVKSIAEGVAALIGSALILFSFGATVTVNAVFAWIPLGLSLFLIEAPVERMARTGHLDNLREIVSHLLFKDRMLRLICGAMTLYGLMTFLVVWMLQPYWGRQGISLSGLGLLWAVQSFVFAIATRASLPLETRFGARPLLVAMALLPVAGYFGMGAAGGVMGIVFSFTFSVSRGLNQVLLTDALNRRVPGRFRATANSLTSLMFRGAYIVAGPGVGLLIVWVGLNGTLLILGSLSLVCFGLFMRLMLTEVGIVERRAPAG